jgi:hypothetical protein
MRALRTCSMSRWSATLAALWCASAAHAQYDPSTAPAPTAAQRAASIEALKKLPDWAGIWTFTMRGARNEQPTLTPAYEARRKAKADGQARGNDANRPSNCMPPGMPTVMTQPYNIEFLFTSDRVTIIQEAYMQVRRVFTDGRKHPEELELSFNGHSIGRWEGDTLVVETVGMKPVTMLGQNLFHSDKLKITERIRLTGPDTLEDRMLIEDPEALAKPWTLVATYSRHREWEQIEFICAENDRNPVDEDGRTEYLLRDKPAE